MIARWCWRKLVAMRQLVVVASVLFAAGMFAFAPTAALAADSTTTLVVSSASPSVFGQSVTFTTTVTDTTNPGAFPTGAVTYEAALFALHRSSFRETLALVFPVRRSDPVSPAG